MNTIYEITSPMDLATFKSEVLDALTRLNDRGTLSKVSVCIDGGVKIKVNELMWTPPMGEGREAN
jgi:hypothetical protein